MKELKALIRQEILGDSLLQAKVGENVYPADLATVPAPKYPCINWAILAGNTDESADEINEVFIMVWVWSRNNYDECWTIYDLFHDLFSREMKIFNKHRFYFREFRKPIEGFESEGKIYQINADWHIRTVEQP